MKIIAAFVFTLLCDNLGGSRARHAGYGVKIAPEQPLSLPESGTVTKLDRKTNVASIRNDKIDGWMEPMIMDYPIENRNEYLSLHKGEKTAATVHVTSEGYWLSDVKERQGD